MSQQPIGQRNTVPSDGLDQGEHGAGVGLSGGVHDSSSHPIADKFMSQPAVTDYSALGTGRVPLAQGITGAIDSDRSGTEQAAHHSHHSHHHHHHHNEGQSGGQQQAFGAGQSEHRATGDQSGLALGRPVGGGATGGSGFPSGYQDTTTTGGTAVSGAYEGGGTRDALTGQSHAETTRPGVGPLGENVPQTSGVGASALAGTAGGAAAASGLSGGSAQSGVGPAGGAGGHYSSESTSGTKQSGSATESSGGGGAGHYGNAEHDPTKGEPISNPKELDTGGPHSLVFQESTGQYVHRRELEK